ncbi:MAG: lysophospholipid acyltransferase family protein [Succiniclasticum sp.]|jgi:KDO2-lipid IV(A) lauroyltransferase|nr:lysophospholipid acyltransferase family protein [Succiniclasticum sp.]MEE3478735.1 lysophospholipid acyltransferase family protein [Succiniclasticum sp.]
MFAYYLMKLISKIFCILPKSWGLAFGNWLGRFALHFVPEWRMEMATANVQECLGLPREEARRVAVQSVVKFGRMIIEVLRFPLLKKQGIDSVVKTDGLEYLEEAYAQGKGVIMCTGHFGNWELLGATVAMHGYPILSIARKQNNGAMDRFINEYREMVGQKIAYNRGKEGVLAMGRYLKQKHLLGILFDQDTNDTGVTLDLFGKKVVTPGGPAVFSRTFGCPVLPIFMHYDPDGSCRAKIYPPIYTARTKDKEKDLYDTTAKLIAILEQEIRSNPPMWFWVHDRWKDGRQRFRKKKQG